MQSAMQMSVSCSASRIPRIGTITNAGTTTTLPSRPKERTAISAPTKPAEIFASARRPNGLAFQVRRDPPGVLDVPAFQNALLSVHTGGPTQVDCYRAGRHFSGTAVHGDIDIIPPGTPARWKLVGEEDRAVLLSVPQTLLQTAAEMLSEPAPQIDLLNRFQVRDPVLEALARAAAQEIEDGCPSGGAYLDGIGLAAASRLLACHSSLAEPAGPQSNTLSGHRLKRVLSYIEDRLGADVSLAEIAASADLSPSHLTTLFRKAMGVTVHQHVVKRRVERAKALLQESALSLAEIALAVGFAHQSHMARHMVRLLGHSPRELRRLRHSAAPQ